MSYSIVAAVQEKVYRIFLPSVAQRAHSPIRRSQAQVIITHSGAPKGRSVAQIAYICAEFPHQLTPLPWAAPEVALELGGKFHPQGVRPLKIELLRRKLRWYAQSMRNPVEQLLSSTAWC